MNIKTLNKNNMDTGRYRRYPSYSVLGYGGRVEHYEYPKVC